MGNLKYCFKKKVCPPPLTNVGRFAYKMFRLQVDSPTLKSIRLHDLRYFRGGVARIFQRGGGHTGSNNIVMAFSPRNIVGCLLKEVLQRRGNGHPRTPLATPLVSPTLKLIRLQSNTEE